MALVVSYHIGGYQAAAPQKNRSEVYDSVAGTYTRWNEVGTQLEQRALTAPETTRLVEQATKEVATTNEAALRTKAAQALTANATFLAITTPSAAQNAAQAKALTRQVNGLIRLLLGALQDVSDT